MTEFLQGQIKDLHIHVERISIDSIPTDSNEQISNWILQRFVLKDKLLKQFDFSHGVLAKSSLNLTKYSCLFFLLTTIVLFLTCQGRSLYGQICFIATPITLLWMYLNPSNKVNNLP